MKEKLPEEFLTRMGQLPGIDLPAFLDALSQQAPISIRYNPAKNAGFPDQLEPVRWAKGAYYLAERKSFTSDPLFHAGHYYVQEASSMLVEQLFRIAFPEKGPGRALDLCAAPGGKSTHLLSLMNQEGLLISNEIHPARNQVLRQNLAKWGYTNLLITHLPSAAFAKSGVLFDLVVCDAPCSGEGLFRKDPEAIQEWSMANVKNCAVRQTNILNEISGIVKENGFLIYSTCTYNEQENDDQLQILVDSGEWSVTDTDLSVFGATKTKFGWQCFPHLVKGEGFYISLLRRQNNNTSERQIKKNFVAEKIPSGLPYIVPGDMLALKIGNFLHVVPETIKYDLSFILQQLPVKSAGFLLGEIKGKDVIPSAESALANISHGSVPEINLDLEEAQKYLRCDSINAAGATKGWNLVKFNGAILGWVKVLEGRVNNYYPKSWRILKDLNRLD